MSAKELSVVFSHPKLTPITGLPTYDSMMTLRQELFSNAGDVALQHGPTDFVGCIMDPAEFVEEYDTEFQPPANPGPFNANHADPQAANLLQLHTELVQIYQRYTRNEQHLKRQLLEAVPAEYVAPLKNRRNGFLNVSVAQLFVHLQKEYGTITHKDLELNTAKLKSPWNPSEGIQAMWTRASACMQMAIDGDSPYTERQLCGYTLQVFQESGAFGSTVEAWYKKPDTTWTWDELHDDFQNAYNALGQTATAKSAGYQTANAATKKHTVVFDESTLCLPFGAKVMFYCGTHGFSTDPGHTSATCNKPGKTHDKEATYDNRCGGVDPIYRPRRNQNARNAAGATTAATTTTA